MERLTLGQVIDNIKVGQVAILVNRDEMCKADGIMINGGINGYGLKIDEKTGELIAIEGRKFRVCLTRKVKGEYILLNESEYNAILKSNQ